MKTEKDWGTTLEGGKPQLFHASSSGAIEREHVSVLQSLIIATKPNIILETGTYVGETALEIGKAIRQNGFGILYTVERQNLFHKEACGKLGIFIGKYIVPILDDSIGFIRMTKFKFDFVILDSEIKIRVSELETLIQYDRLNTGCIIAIHDTGKWRKECVEGEQKWFRNKLNILSKKYSISMIELPYARGLTLCQF